MPDIERIDAAVGKVIDTPQTRRPRVRPYASPETSLLTDILRGGKPGDTITDGKLSAARGKNVGTGGDGAGNLASAMRFVLRECGVVWRRVRKAGMIRCLNAAEIILTVENDRRHITRVARRATKRVKCADLDTLPESERPAAIALNAQLGSIALFGAKSVTRAFTSHTITGPVDVKKMIEAMPK